MLRAYVSQEMIKLMRICVEPTLRVIPTIERDGIYAHVCLSIHTYTQQLHKLVGPLIYLE